MMAMPCSAMFRTRPCSRSISSRPMAAVGSSMITSSASMDSALAISTICCSATDRSSMIRRGSSSMPSFFRIAELFR